MADWTPSGNFLIGQNIDETSTTKKHELGTIVTMKHATYGVGEFIYLVGVTGTDAGKVVSYDAATFQTALASIAAGVGRPVAVAMSANVGSQYGWYQIGGVAVVDKASATSFAAAAPLGATSGLAVAAATTVRLANAVVQAAASGGSAVTSVNVAINRPAGPSSD
jgi:hypothetical protein